MVAAVFLAVSCIAKNRKSIFLWQALNCLLLAIASYFFRSYAGITTLFFCGLRNLLIVWNRYTKNAMFILLLGIVLTGLWANNRGIVGLLPIIATVEYTICCHYIRSEHYTRWSILINEVIWLTYSFLILDIFTAVSDGIVILVDGIAIYKNSRK